MEHGMALIQLATMNCNVVSLAVQHLVELVQMLEQITSGVILGNRDYVPDHGTYSVTLALAHKVLFSSHIFLPKKCVGLPVYRFVVECSS